MIFNVLCFVICPHVYCLLLVSMLQFFISSLSFFFPKGGGGRGHVIKFMIIHKLLYKSLMSLDISHIAFKVCLRYTKIGLKSFSRCFFSNIFFLTCDDLHPCLVDTCVLCCKTFGKGMFINEQHMTVIICMEVDFVIFLHGFTQ